MTTDNSFTTYLRIKQTEKDVGFVILGRADIATLFKKADLFYNDKLVASGYVTDITPTTLTSVSDKDLSRLPRAYADKTVFWRKVELAYGGGLPGEFEVTFMTLSSTLPSVQQSAPKKTPKKIPEKTPKKIPEMTLANTYRSLEDRMNTSSLKNLLKK